MQSLLMNRAMVHGVVETPRGAHFTSCVPDYGRDEEFQRRYAAAAASDRRPGREFRREFLGGDEADYQAAVAGSRGPGAGGPMSPAVEASETSI